MPISGCSLLSQRNQSTETTRPAQILVCDLRDPRVPPHSNENKSYGPIPFNLKLPIFKKNNNKSQAQQSSCFVCLIQGMERNSFREKNGRNAPTGSVLGRQGEAAHSSRKPSALNFPKPLPAPSTARGCLDVECEAKKKRAFADSCPKARHTKAGWWESHGAGMFLLSAALTIFPLCTAPGF